MGGAENTNFFEGVEKLLELWFSRADGKHMMLSNCDLRRIPRKQMEALLALVKCEIIGFMTNDVLDSYVLSESSMFVSKSRFILKTCGTTTPLECLKPLLGLIATYTGFDKIEEFFYSRKNFKKPELQLLPHRSFEDEVTLLDSFFPDGSAYSLGSINRDCWYLYTLNSPRMAAFNNNHGTGFDLGLDNFGLLSYNNANNKMPKMLRFANPALDVDGELLVGQGIQEPDQTLEILMTHLDPKIMAIFTKEVCSTGKEATIKSGIDRIIPNIAIDEHLFAPCGYSMNGAMKNGSYMTIHITPEPDCSYVSFETNIAQSSYIELIGRVLDTFQPGKFVLTLFANQASAAYNVGQTEIEQMAMLKKWLRVENQFCHLKNYDLTYALYAKFPS